MGLTQGQTRIQRTDHQIIFQVWCQNRKLTIYLDQSENGTNVEIYQVKNKDDVSEPQTDFIQSLEWLTEELKEA